MTQIATTSASPSSFWTFSLSVYGQPGVPAACLTLQDEGGADVNRDSLLGVEFTEEPVDIKQGDPTAVVALPFMALARRSI